MEKAHSVIDENISERLVQEALEVVFIELDRYVSIMKNFSGVDWPTYVRATNDRRRRDKPVKDDFIPLYDEEGETKEDEDKNQNLDEAAAIER